MPKVANEEVGDVGYGLMGLTWRPDPLPEEQSFAAMRAALSNGCNLWNGAEFYGTPERNSLTLLRQYYDKYPEDADKVVLSVKGCLGPDHSLDCSPEGVRKSVTNCLDMLGERGKIAMFAPGRRDPKVPLQQTLRELDRFVQEGKIGGVALSEVSAKTIEQAAQITKIAAVEIELSLWQTDPLHNGITKVCKELGIPIMAYSPMGNGMLTGHIKSASDIPEGDIRRLLPRFKPENFEVNVKLVRALEKIAKRKNCTAAQLAISWVVTLSKRPDMPVIIPIPGATKAARLEENSRIFELTEEELQEIDEVLANHSIVGDRYPPEAQKLVNG
ncbi:Pyridoxal reductase [Lasiodiplodia theobromae]|uniref:Pyridoxal reductase n=1 Tax=Lasiodiplodia theobromae TaxID=45133 RepID=A0A5N5D3Q7_9PEZI|nr:Pyridoxal reductase [Lasiodiplodia theobromae]